MLVNLPDYPLTTHMQTLDSKVMVITGGASGIGLALARRGLHEGARVVIADVNAAKLETALAELDGGDNMHAVPTDVSDPVAVENLAQQTISRYGAVDVVVNNAGIGGGGVVWEHSEADWDWMLGVNLRGVISGVRVFTPLLIERPEAYMINTASVAGLLSAPGNGSYTVAKHGVVALTELLYGDLRNAGHNHVGVSVLCPSVVDTAIYQSERLRPGHDGAKLSDEQRAELEAIEAMTHDFLAAGISADTVAEQVFEGMRKRRFYLLTHPAGTRPLVEQRMHAILHDGVPPMSGPHEYPVTE